MEGIDRWSGHPICYLVVTAGDVSDFEAEGLEKRSPAANDGGLRCFDPLEVAVVGFN